MSFQPEAPYQGQVSNWTSFERSNAFWQSRQPQESIYETHFWRSLPLEFDSKIRPLAEHICDCIAMGVDIERPPFLTTGQHLRIAMVNGRICKRRDEHIEEVRSCERARVLQRHETNEQFFRNTPARTGESWRAVGAPLASIPSELRQPRAPVPFTDCEGPCQSQEPPPLSQGLDAIAAACQVSGDSVPRDDMVSSWLETLEVPPAARKDAGLSNTWGTQPEPMLQQDMPQEASLPSRAPPVADPDSSWDTVRAKATGSSSPYGAAEFPQRDSHEETTSSSEIQGDSFVGELLSRQFPASDEA
ncbi:hypothetical protein FZEAL_4290 [Fusarium zealandicum]|uniref:Uncharacterized protein n=1 Tax=Fusarium zealandicum TaxID=1053134 RepID=A0A8H4XKY3_9HYPO|nr:hypothetical protein FZEAL_4290 [Fusarium zealandicum]